MFESNIKEMKDKVSYIQALGEIYKLLEDERTWNCMKYHEPDETHDDPWFTLPDDIKTRYKAYSDVLYHIRVLVGNL